MNWQGLRGVLKDADLISGNKDLENSTDDGALDRDYLSPKLKRAEQQARDQDSLDATVSRFCEPRHSVKLLQSETPPKNM